MNHASLPRRSAGCLWGQRSAQGVAASVRMLSGFWLIINIKDELLVSPHIVIPCVTLWRTSICRPARGVINLLMGGRYLTIHAKVFSGCSAGSDFLYWTLVHFLLLDLNKKKKKNQIVTVWQCIQDLLKLLLRELGKMDDSLCMCVWVCVVPCTSLRPNKLPKVLRRGQWIIIIILLGHLALSKIDISRSVYDRWLFGSSRELVTYLTLNLTRCHFSVKKASPACCCSLFGILCTSCTAEISMNKHKDLLAFPPSFTLERSSRWRRERMQSLIPTPLC